VSGKAGTGSPHPDDEQDVGEALARLRHNAGLTMVQLGKIAGISQSTISRTEKGAKSSAATIRRLATALGASREYIDALLAHAEHSTRQDRVIDWRVGRGGVAAKQREVERLEMATREFRVFQPSFCPGLLQTSEYARQVLLSVQETVTSDEDRPTMEAVTEAVSARLKRQTILAHPDKRFRFLVTESALRNELCSPADMAAQLQVLRKVAREENVSLRIIRPTTRWPVPPYHGFELLDQNLVITDLFNTSLTLRGRRDVEIYGLVFDKLEALGTPDIDPIIDSYLELYLELARPSHSAGDDRPIRSATSR
jgi:transcriptional regulator with XRE-family HTH domain